jgi:cell wall-associated NlpC family hydrolase
LTSPTARRPWSPRRSWSLGVSLLLTLCAFNLLTAPAGAKPNPAGLSERLDRQNQEADALVEEYNQKKIALDQTRLQLSGLSARVKDAQDKHAALQVQVDAMGAGAYTMGPTEGVMALFTADPAKAIKGIETLDIMAQRNEDLMSQYKSIDATLRAMRAELAGTAKRQADELADMAKQKAKLDKSVATTESLLAQARAQHALDHRDASQDNGAKPKPGGGGPVPHASGNAGAAIAYAAARIGLPYCYGGSGPGCYDCSGLVMMAWRAGGKSLPHSSSAMYSSLPHVSNPVPGDIVHYPGHVALYIGGGRQIAATHTGDYVRNQPVRSGAVYLRP